MPKKLTPQSAHEIVLSHGFQPLEPFQGLRIPWRCLRLLCGHEFQTKYESIQQETAGCPICSGHTVQVGFNDLATKFPEVAAQANGWDPTTVTAKSGKKLRWLCSLNHAWSATVASRTDGRGCPICSGHTVQVGFNDLATKFPEVAAQANGWDPTLVNPGTDAKRSWKCVRGHLWVASVVKRTSSNRGCPFCSNNQVLSGFNDLATKFPEVAAQASGWDPTLVSSKSKQKLEWICSDRHIWSAAVGSRTAGGNGCPVCRNLVTISGINDLATKFPEIAAQASGWDPTLVNSGSGQRKKWKCKLGHTWVTQVQVRTSRKSGCPTCGRKNILAGFNDLATTHPNIALMAHGWDPTTVISGSHQIKEWKCSEGHISRAKVQTRARGVYCPYCSGLYVLAGFNDLATTHPNIAAESVDWDPKKVIAGTHIKYKWRCSEGHEWMASPKHRAFSGEGCPSCTKYGYTPTAEGWFYFLEHGDLDLFQIGITNSPNDRLHQHQLGGWTTLEIRGPMDGGYTQRLERDVLKTLKKRDAKFAKKAGMQKFDGYTEAWTKASVPVTSIRQLLEWVYEDEGILIEEGKK